MSQLTSRYSGARWNTLIGRKDSAVSTVKAPHKWDRLQRFFWSQMPFHPQYVEENTQYEMALTQDLQLPAGPPPPPQFIRRIIRHSTTNRSRWSIWSPCIHVCRTDLNSATAKAGDPVEAIVTQPVFDANNNELLIPQNSILHGKVLRAPGLAPLGTRRHTCASPSTK